MRTDTFFKEEKHLWAWYYITTECSPHEFTEAREAIDLWMQGRVRAHPYNLQYMEECKDVINHWSKWANNRIRGNACIIYFPTTIGYYKEELERENASYTQHLEIFASYLQEIDACIQCLTLLMASHPRLGQDSPLFQLPPENLQLIARFI